MPTMVLIKYYKYDVLLILSRQAVLVICGQIPDMGPHTITRLLYATQSQGREDPCLALLIRNASQTGRVQTQASNTT